EAGVLSAMQLGARIGLLLGATRMIPVLEERLRGWGVAARVAAIATPPDGVRPGTDDEVMQVFGGLAREMIARDRVEAIVLGGGCGGGRSEWRAAVPRPRAGCIVARIPRRRRRRGACCWTGRRRAAMAAPSTISATCSSVERAATRRRRRS